MTEDFSLTSRGPKLFEHPIFSRAPHHSFWTPPVERLFLSMQRHVIQRQSFYVDELTGGGKSCAMHLATNKIAREWRLTVIRYNAKTNQFNSTRAFLKEMLHALQIEKTSGETWDIRNRVRNRVEELCEVSRMKTLFLWIDEGQALSDYELAFFRDLQSDLLENNKDLILFLVGDGIESRSDIKPAERERFVLNRVRVSRYTNEDVRSLFAQMDTAIFPAGSAISWPGYFLPKAVLAGFKLSVQAETCSEVFRDCLKQEVVEIQPRMLRRAVGLLLLQLENADSGDLCVTSDHWMNAIRRTIAKL